MSVVLSADNKRQMYVPPGLAHGFCVTSETALFTYKCTEFYAPEAERGIIWNARFQANPEQCIENLHCRALQGVPPDRPFIRLQ